MKKLFLLVAILLSLIYMGSCDGKEDNSSIDIIMPVDSTSTAVTDPE